MTPEQLDIVQQFMNPTGLDGPWTWSAAELDDVRAYIRELEAENEQLHSRLRFLMDNLDCIKEDFFKLDTRLRNTNDLVTALDAKRATALSEARKLSMLIRTPNQEHHADRHNHALERILTLLETGEGE